MRWYSWCKKNEESFLCVMWSDAMQCDDIRWFQAMQSAFFCQLKWHCNLVIPEFKVIKLLPWTLPSICMSFQAKWTTIHMKSRCLMLMWSILVILCFMHVNIGTLLWFNAIRAKEQRLSRISTPLLRFHLDG